MCCFFALTYELQIILAKMNVSVNTGRNILIYGVELIAISIFFTSKTGKSLTCLFRIVILTKYKTPPSIKILDLIYCLDLAK
jgi:hypothetical protein